MLINPSAGFSRDVASRQGTAWVEGLNKDISIGYDKARPVSARSPSHRPADELGCDGDPCSSNHGAPETL